MLLLAHQSNHPNFRRNPCRKRSGLVSTIQFRRFIHCCENRTEQRLADETQNWSITSKRRFNLLLPECETKKILYMLERKKCNPSQFFSTKHRSPATNLIPSYQTIRTWIRFGRIWRVADRLHQLIPEIYDPAWVLWQKDSITSIHCLNFIKQSRSAEMAICNYTTKSKQALKNSFHFTHIYVINIINRNGKFRQRTAVLRIQKRQLGKGLNLIWDLQAWQIIIRKTKV